MQRPASWLLAAVFLALATIASSQDLAVKEIDLDNGMKVLLYQRPGDPNVAAGWIAHVGSVNEQPGITGLSHLFEHMMFKGTHVIGTSDIKRDLELNAEQDAIRAEIRAEQAILDEKQRLGHLEDAQDPAARSARHSELLVKFQASLDEQKKILKDNEFDKIYTDWGGSGMNAFTNYDVTCYFISVPSNKLEGWFWMEADRLANPVFRQFYSERDVVWEERRMRTDSTPTGKLDEQFEAMFWMASPYAWPVIGWPSDLNGITREEANAYFAANYAPNNLTAALVGDFDPAQAEALARKYFGPLKRGKVLPAEVRTYSPAQMAMRRFEGEADTRPTVKIRWPGVAHDHVDEPALAVLSDLLTGETGRLQMSLVKGQKIASAASAGIDGRKYGGLFQIDGVAATGHSVEEVEAAIQAEVKKIQEQPVDAKELQKVKNQALASKYRRLDGNFLIMVQLLVYDVLSSWKTMSTETTKYLAVTAADVQRVAQKYLKDELRNVAVYRTKAKPQAEGADAASSDPLFDALPPDQQQAASQMKAQFGAIPDAAMLEQVLAQVTGQMAAAPPEQQALGKWLISFIEARIATLKGGK